MTSKAGRDDVRMKQPPGGWILLTAVLTCVFTALIAAVVMLTIDNNCLYEASLITRMNGHTPRSELPTSERNDPSTNITAMKNGPMLIFFGGRTDGNDDFLKVDSYSLQGGDIKHSGERHSLPYISHRAGAVLWNRQVFLVGGENGGVHSDRVAMYDVDKDKWRRYPDMTTGRGSSPCVFIQRGRLYAAGGKQNRFTSIEALNLSDLDAGWSQMPKAKLPNPVYMSACAVVQDTVFIAGGYYSSYNTPNLISWSVGSPEWTPRADMIKARSRHCMATDGKNNIWVVGGRSDRTVERYTISSDTWKFVSSLPYSVESSVCFYYDGLVIVAGGSRERLTPSDRILVYNTSANVWKESLTFLRQPLYEHSAVLIR